MSQRTKFTYTPRVQLDVDVVVDVEVVVVAAVEEGVVVARILSMELQEAVSLSPPSRALAAAIDVEDLTL